MMRGAMRLLLFVLVGGMVNIAVAWLCALQVTDQSNERAMALRIGDVRRWIDHSPGTFMLQFGPSRQIEARGLLRTDVEADRPHKAGRWHRVSSVEAGLPLPALRGERWTHVADQVAATKTEFVSAMDPAALGLYRAANADRLFPLQPILPGFITNTIFFAMVLWVAAKLPRFLRSSSRQLRTRCLACGESLPADERWRCARCGWVRGIVSSHEARAL